jgi:DNA-directed RNA polymerase specialized sigma subunit
VKCDLLTKLGAAKDPFSLAVVAWNKTGGRDALRQVLGHLRPIVGVRASDYPLLGKAVTAAELTRAALIGLRKYNPGKGTTAKTWAISSMKAASRPLLRRAIPMRIPDARLQAVGRLQRARSEGVTGKELLRQARISKGDAARLQREVKPILIQSKEEIPHGVSAPRYKEVSELISHELSPKELLVYDMLKQGAKTGEMAKRLKVSPASISLRKAAIRKKMERFL